MASTSTTELVFFIAAIIASTAVAGIILSAGANQAQSLTERGLEKAEKIRTDVKIINDPMEVPYDGTNLTIYVKNTGTTDIPLSKLDVLIDGYFQTQVNVTDFDGDGVWWPGENAKVNVTNSSLGGNQTIKIISGSASDTLSVDIDEVSLDVVTLGASDINETSATLNGELLSTGGASSVDVYFEWREAGTSTWSTTSKQTLSSTGEFSHTLTGLSEGVEYEFRAVADTGTETDTGTILTFTTNSNWHMFSYNTSNTGYNPDAFGPKGSVSEEWSYSTGGAVRSSPAVVDGVVYIGSNDNSVYALYANNGTEKWSYSTGGNVVSSPAVVNDVVYVGSNDGNVYALYSDNGTEKWNYSTGGSIISSPTVENGVVYFGSNDGNA
ncbi:MAG: PQQ-binding-like beta-propeller repeat protein, partial [Halobacteria archaeon]|nr:PQQ-binding-like beta-propeller repeat protein [Halobacteria archaeon]